MTKMPKGRIVEATGWFWPVNNRSGDALYLTEIVYYDMSSSRFVTLDEKMYTLDSLVDDWEEVDHSGTNTEMGLVEGRKEVPHYTHGNIECIDYLKDNMDPAMFMGFLEGNTKKYLHRYRYKGKPVEDLEKAKVYLDWLIKEMKGS